MDDKSLRKTLSDILSKVTNNTNVSNDLQKDVQLIIELVNTIDQRVADISMKVDQFLNAGAKKPNAVPKKTPTKAPAKKAPAKKAPAKKKNHAKEPSTNDAVEDDSDDVKDIDEDDNAENAENAEITPIGQIKNILSYFKTRYGEDPESFTDHLEENQAESLFSEHEDAINAKKEGEVRTRFKATLLYKGLTKSQKEKVREMMTSEKEQADADNSNDLEPEVDNESD
jgi:hypothetical protein